MNEYVSKREKKIGNIFACMYIIIYREQLIKAIVLHKCPRLTVSRITLLFILCSAYDKLTISFYNLKVSEKILEKKRCFRIESEVQYFKDN